MASFYDSKQRWTAVFILIAICITIATVLISNSFVERIAEEEQHQVEVWAQAMRAISAHDTLKEKETMDLMVEIFNGNKSIPVLLCNEDDSVVGYNNIIFPKKDSIRFLKEKVEDFKAKNEPMPIETPEYTQYLYYDESIVLKRLTIYPYIQLAVVSAFIMLAFLGLTSAKKAEQNKVWVGLSKETAHQLGTPISSLIAWVEYLKTKDVDASYLKEMDKDVRRLETIAERFSKIGSNPEHKPININEAVQLSYEYMSIRISNKIQLIRELSEKPIFVVMNESLFSWVIENLTKNAADAMDGVGTITYSIEEGRKKVFVDVTDTGKGIVKSKFKTVFNPGYTTKKRGWGLGLSLVKRIVESYPGGKIYVKSSELGKYTTFRIELRKYQG
ncbi:MAG: HAMP domain-containing histidine kinase [Tannerella sp.]|jgi:two-component sensor histidine kinase|nr:HAMP domain-containing histidine kinase [Tannerella sp.]